MSAFNGCTIDTQKGFGPANVFCYGGFDFTLYFEETVLSIAPLFLVLPFLALRLFQLIRAPVVVNGGNWHLAKQVWIYRLL